MLTELKRIRLAAGLSREKLAQRADLSTQTIENAEKGLGVWTSTAAKIADALGVTVDELMGKPAEKVS